jgi:3-deoxy-manno-octulosonate cytidylyltransferase (CMP-KDO synthetase)
MSLGTNNKIACLIPARYNSSRFPGKLLAIALGKTVLQRTIESALEAFKPEQLFIATDDERIAQHVQSLGCNAIWTDPNHINGSDRIAEAVLKTPALQRAEIIVNLQGDHPCTRPATLRAAVDILISDPNAVMSTVAIALKNEEDFFSPHVVKVVVSKNGNALYFSRSPIPYFKGALPSNALQHIGLYCFRRDFLLEYSRMKASDLQKMEDLEQLKILEEGYRIKVAIVEEESVAVDTPSDLIKLVQLLQREKNNVG